VTDTARISSQPGAAIPPDNPQRALSVASSDDPKARHINIWQHLYDPPEWRRHRRALLPD